MLIYTYFKYQGEDSLLLARKAVAHYCALCHKDSLEAVRRDGVIYLSDGYISISHTANIFVVAISDSAVGVDIERITGRDYKRMSERLFGRAPQTEREFISLWTRYEAEYKAKYITPDAEGKFTEYTIYKDTVLSAYGKDSDIAFIPMETLDI